MKNRHLAILALVCALIALFLSAAAIYMFKTQPDLSGKIAALEEQNQALQARLEELTAVSEPTAPVTELADWSLVPDSVQDVSAAVITFRAVPVEAAEGLKASLIVCLNDSPAAEAECTFADGEFTASVELPAANGYTYYCSLTDSTGAVRQLPLVTPEQPDDLLMNLADSLNYFVSLTVEDFLQNNEQLTVYNSYLQFQLPLIGTSGGSQYSRAQLVLCRNGDALSNQTVVLEPGEAAGVYEALVESASFSMTEPEDGDLLELLLEVVLSDGTTLMASGFSWFCEDGSLIPAEG